MKIAIVGWGAEAQSAYRRFGPNHDYLIVNEAKQDNFPPESDRLKVHYLQGTGHGLRGKVKDLSYLKGIENCDLIIYQPTAYFNLQKTFGDNTGFWQKAKTAYDIFFEETPTENIIGVTGTKGKGTTSVLITKLLEAQGKTVYLGGNFGTPVLDLLGKIGSQDWLVWEMANFQLKAASYSPHIGVCLDISQEHLDWHPSFEDYIEAKANIFKHQKLNDKAIYFAQNEYSKQIADYSSGEKIPYFQKPGAYLRDDGMIVIGSEEKPIIHKSEVKLLGEHNLQNICAALTAVYEAVGSIDKAEEVLSDFSGLEHRLEHVREFEGVKYYNDSFAANPEASIAAIKAVAGPKIVILGGYERNLPLDGLIKVIDDNRAQIIKLILIGQSAQRLATELKTAGFNELMVSKESSMPLIVKAAQDLAKPGSSVVFSPGFASFDMFKDFEARGVEYKSAVNQL